jgi:hypothetical protein
LPLLGADRVKLAVSWVYAQSRGAAPAVTDRDGHD